MGTTSKLTLQLNVGPRSNIVDFCFEVTILIVSSGIHGQWIRIQGDTRNWKYWNLEQNTQSWQNSTSQATSKKGKERQQFGAGPLKKGPDPLRHLHIPSTDAA